MTELIVIPFDTQNPVEKFLIDFSLNSGVFEITKTDIMGIQDIERYNLVKTDYENFLKQTIRATYHHPVLDHYEFVYRITELFSSKPFDYLVVKKKPEYNEVFIGLMV